MSALRDALGLGGIGSVRVRDGGGLASYARVMVRDGAGLHQVFGQFGASASPAAVYGSASSSGSVRVTTSAATATPDGGSGPFTYLWETADAGWEAVTPTAQSTMFRSPFLSPNTNATAQFICTVTDAFGGSAETGPVSATCFNINIGVF